MKRQTITAKQARFIAEYLIDLNGSEAAIRAGYSPGSARRIATRLLREPNIAAEVQRRQAEHLERAGITAEGVLEQLQLIASFDPISIYDEHLNVMPLRDWPAAARAAVSSYDTGTRGNGADAKETVVKVKFESKLQALALLAKHLGLLTNQPKVDNHVTISWLPPEPALALESETIDTGPMGPPQGLDAGRSQSPTVQDEMGFAEPAPGLPHGTHASSSGGLYESPSSSIEDELSRSMEATGMSQRALERLLPELRTPKGKR
jgi:phage terminase small subunit